MKSKITCLVINLLILFNVLSCSYIGGYFPDKQKDYQFTTEIPALSIPDDLANTQITDVNEIQSSQPIKHQKLTDQAENSDTNQTKDSETEESIYIDLVEFSGGATRIRIEDSIQRSWRKVGKALSRQSIEITDRDEMDKVYFVQYDPDFKKVEDGSFWDEILFLFGSDPAQEKEFRIRLVENGALTEIIVLDKNDIPLSEGNGFKLLNLLYRTLKEDLANLNG